MNRPIMTAALVLAVSISSLMAQPAAKQPMAKSKAEMDAIQAMLSAQDPDSRIKAAEDLLNKYADTEFKALALQVEAMSYQQKNDYPKMVVYAERTLQADPNNYSAMLMLAQGIAQHTRENDLDREEKLASAEKYARSAEEIIKKAPKPNPQLPDEQWEEAKKEFTAQSHEALGLAAMARKNYDVAISEFKTAIEGPKNPDPATMVRLGAVYNLAGKPDDAIAVLDKVMAMPDVNPQLKQFAQAERARAIQAKGGAKPANPPNPPAEKKP